MEVAWVVTYHTKLATHFVREVTESQHAHDRSGEGETADNCAVVVGGDIVRTIYTLQD